MVEIEVVLGHYVRVGHAATAHQSEGPRLLITRFIGRKRGNPMAFHQVGKHLDPGGRGLELDPVVAVPPDRLIAQRYKTGFIEILDLDVQIR